jgi:thiosulfate reductase cytochrome b subunit
MAPFQVKARDCHNYPLGCEPRVRIERPEFTSASAKDQRRTHMPLAQTEDASPHGPRLVKRHALSTRLWHWINAGALCGLLMSGLMIFNAHPRLYWGHKGSFGDQAWMEIGSTAQSGYLRVGPAQIETTGYLGLWLDDEGKFQKRAFPERVTLPSAYSLSLARNWHFALAWLLALALTLFLTVSLCNGHIVRELHIRREEWNFGHIWADIKAHARLRFPSGAAALRYNILQKLSYNAVIFLLIPTMIVSGLAMSPAMNAAWPWLIDLFGGRQSARSLHFICAFLLLGFFIVHMIMVLLAGPFNEMRSIVTGWYRVRETKEDSA